MSAPSRWQATAPLLDPASIRAAVPAAPLPPPHAATDASDAAPSAAAASTTSDVSCFIAATPASRTLHDLGTAVIEYLVISPDKPLAATDWVGAYSPPPRTLAELQSVVPVRWAAVTSGDTGSKQLKLPNYRAAVSFFYFSGGLQAPILVCNSSGIDVDFADYNEPRAPRIAPINNTAVRVLWSSANASAPTLLWGTNPGELANAVPASTSHLAVTDVCGAPANTVGWRDMGALHTAVISPPADAAAVYYSFGGSGLWSEEASFHPLPAPGGRTSRSGALTRIAIVCDLGRGTSDETHTWGEYGTAAVNTSAALAVEAEAGALDALFLIGDASYAQGLMSTWDDWLSMMTTTLAYTPLLVSQGNHEMLQGLPAAGTLWDGNDAGGECGVVAAALLPMPSPATATAAWWALDIGLLHLVALSTEQAFSTGSPQWEWLRADLMSVDRGATPWVVVTSHRPMYIDSTDNNRSGSDQAVAALLQLHVEPLLWSNRVNLHLSGHNHAAQWHSASFGGLPIQRSTTLAWTDAPRGRREALLADPPATAYVVWGTGGAPFSMNANGTTPTVERVLYRYGYGALTLHNATHLCVDWLPTDAGAGAAPLDRLWVTQTGTPWVLPTPLPVSAPLVAGAFVAGILGALLVVATGAALAWRWRRWRKQRYHSVEGVGGAEVELEAGGDQREAAPR